MFSFLTNCLVLYYYFTKSSKVVSVVNTHTKTLTLYWNTNVIDPLLCCLHYEIGKYQKQMGCPSVCVKLYNLYNFIDHPVKHLKTLRITWHKTIYSVRYRNDVYAIRYIEYIKIFYYNTAQGKSKLGYTVKNKDSLDIRIYFTFTHCELGYRHQRIHHFDVMMD